MAPPTVPSERKEKDAKAIKALRVDGKSTSNTPKKRTVESILEAAANISFNNTEEAQEWWIRSKDKIAKKSGNQILHLLAKKRRLHDMAWTEHQIKDFLDWTLERHHSLLEVKNGDQYTPLHLAIMNHNDAFVKAVLENEKLVNLGTVLSETCQYGNSLHVAIKYSLPSIELMIDKCAQFSGMFDRGQPVSGDTPLHSCMSIDLTQEDGDENDSESDEASDNYSEGDDNSRNRSYQGRDSLGAGGDDLQDARNMGYVVNDNTMGRATRPSDVLQPSIATQRRRSQSLSQRTESTMVPLLKVVELLIQKRDSVLSSTNEENRTPYQERVHRLLENDKRVLAANNTKDREEAERTAIAKDPIASYIRSYCMTNNRFSRDRIMEALYRPEKERHIEFDLGGLPHATISEDYLDRLAKHLQFESILKYVALPKLTLEPNTVVRQRRGEQRPRRRGLSHLVTVFNWLRKNHVEKIVKLMVVDDTDPSHCDVSIEEAVGGFGVEIWDWKRLDLSTNVIWRATTPPGNKEVSVVREISLYSTGNDSVLMGWASPQGLTDKEKFPALKKVNLYIREGLEDEDRLNEYIENFKETITVSTDGRVEVNHVLDDKVVSYASDLKSSGGSLHPENSWVDCVSNFARFLHKAEAASNTRRIRIAIIDDGVDASVLSLDGKIAVGKSFCPYANSTDLMSSYYAPSGNHGTCMATLICKMCPDVSLYVARLDERQTPGSSYRQITAKSAADAIRWAAEIGVDIISMSWTIERPVTGNEEMESLKDAVREAASKGILMFCSTSDQGNSTNDNCYPGDFDGCIKIGGATGTGEALAWVNVQKVDFLLPGKIMSYESGSSIATAAASALAGLLMFSNRLLNKDDNYFQDHKNMRQSFKNLCSENKFLRVQDYFDLQFKQALSRYDSSDGDSHRPRVPTTSYNFKHMKWDSKCSMALEDVLRRIKWNP